MEGLIYLEDGTLLEGGGFGARKTTVGELVFNTSMTGYQEILTDPSYDGQIITLTYPLAGNYGVTELDHESNRIHAFGLVVKNVSSHPSNALCVSSLDQWLQEQNVPGVFGVDTRALTRKIRQSSTVKCVLSTEGISPEQAKALCDSVSLQSDQMKAAGVGEHLEFPSVAAAPSPQPAPLPPDLLHLPRCRAADKGPFTVAVLDLGVKSSILSSLTSRGCKLHLFPYGTSAQELLSVSPDGIFLTNGPGDPAQASEAVVEIRKLISQATVSRGIPLFGICMGHQLLALAMGAQTYKLPYGHRGGNHGVSDCFLGRSYITSQNHGYAVREDSAAAAGLEVTHRNLNDGTVEGLRHPELPLFSVQFHPEASPGPQDSGHLFDLFVELMKGGRWHA